MNYINRSLQPLLDSAINRGKSILLLGPRQVGKTTLVQELKADLLLSLIQPRVRLRYEKDPSVLADEINAMVSMSKKPLVIIDEVQKAPYLMDVVQDLIDRNLAQFVLTGSSARKLKRGDAVNLLPGRVLPMQLNALSIDEIPSELQRLEDLLIYGSLPGVITLQTAEEKEELLDAYVSLYLEEEIRAEAIVRNLANFARFLELAASESGATSNYSKLSQAIGVAHNTIAQYYQILEDCLIAQRVEPFTQSSTRKKLSKTQKYIMFDLGVRRLAAREGHALIESRMGQLFEQFVVLELQKKAQLHPERIAIRYWRDPDGPEVDCVVDGNGVLIPIEVKYSERPERSDSRHLQTFLNEYPQANKGYIVCRTPRRLKLTDQIDAIPWQELTQIIE